MVYQTGPSFFLPKDIIAINGWTVTCHVWWPEGNHHFPHEKLVPLGRPPFFWTPILGFVHFGSFWDMEKDKEEHDNNMAFTQCWVAHFWATSSTQMFPTWPCGGPVMWIVHPHGALKKHGLIGSSREKFPQLGLKFPIFLSGGCYFPVSTCVHSRPPWLGFLAYHPI